MTEQDFHPREITLSNSASHHRLRDLDVTDCQAAERRLDREIHLDRAVRFKVTDTCRFACTYCHNEGTSVSANNQLALLRNSFESSNFYSRDAEPSAELREVLGFFARECGMQEVHITGGQPDRNPHLPRIVEAISESGLQAKMTSNGERGAKGIRDLGNAGLTCINYSIHGLTVGELVATQHPNYPQKLLERNIETLLEAIDATLESGITTKANLVVTPDSGEARVTSALELLDARVQLRLQPELKQQQQGLALIRWLLARCRARAVRRIVHPGSSNESVEYWLNGDPKKPLWVKYFRHSRLSRDDACNNCAIDARGECDEGYYGPKLYRTDDGYMIGTCILRMELNRPFREVQQEHAIDPVRSLATAIRQQPFQDALQLVTNPDELATGGRFVWEDYRKDAAGASYPNPR